MLGLVRLLRKDLNEGMQRKGFEGEGVKGDVWELIV